MNDNPRSKSGRFSRFAKAVFLLAILVAAFYGVENWRGHRAWEARKAELTAKGEVMEWKAFIPQPVPDDQNIMKAPIMQSWFIKSSNKPPARFQELASYGKTTTAAGMIFTDNPLIILTSESKESPGPGDVVIPMADLGSKDLMVLITEPTTQESRSYPAPMGGVIQATRFKTIPKKIYVKAAAMPDVKEMENLINAQDRTVKKQGQFTVLPTPQNHVFQLQQKVYAPDGIYYAAEFIAWSDGFKSEFDAIREAVRRPYVRMDGSYITPLDQDIPNFVTLRTVSQIFASRAYAHLLLNQPDNAEKDLAFIKDLTRCLEGDRTLVSAMIKVAIFGMYGIVAQNGFLDNKWQEPQWVAISEQIKNIDLLETYANSMRGERNFVFLLDNTSASELKKVFQSTSKERFFATIGPRGWLRQNQAFFAGMHQKHLDLLNLKEKVFQPSKMDAFINSFKSDLEHLTPYTWFSSIAFPNFSKACQTTLRNQTLLNQLRIVCALERYRKVNGSYPENLEALQPGLIEKVPHDLIGGHPLKYRRMPDNQFTLHSIAWNEKDDEGTGEKDLDWSWTIRR